MERSLEKEMHKEYTVYHIRLEPGDQILSSS